MMVVGDMAYQMEVEHSNGLMAASMLAVGAWRMIYFNKRHVLSIIEPKLSDSSKSRNFLLIKPKRF
jgi:hypothetical protein